MKEVQCKQCGKKEFVPDEMPEPYFCNACSEAYAEEQAKDQEIEQELEEEEAERQADWEEENRRELNELC